MDVSKNRGTPKSSTLIGFSIINHPFWGTPIFGNTHIVGGGRSYFFVSRERFFRCFGKLYDRICCPKMVFQMKLEYA